MRGRGEFLSPEQWNSLEQSSLNKFFTSKCFLPNEEKYEQHSWQGITTCSHMLLVKLMNLLLGLNILFRLPHTLTCFHVLECSFFAKYWKHFVKTMFASIKYVLWDWTSGLVLNHENLSYVAMPIIFRVGTIQVEEKIIFYLKSIYQYIFWLVHFLFL